MGDERARSGPATGPAVVWLRRALRLADNPALTAACERHAEVAVVYVRETDGRWAPGAAARAWLAHSLAALDASLRDRGSRLVVLDGPATTTLPAFARAIGASAVHFDRSYVAETAEADARVTAALAAAGVAAYAHDCTLLGPPDAPLTAAGRPYQVFTPYFNAARRLTAPRTETPAPGALLSPGTLPDGLPVTGATGLIAAAAHAAAPRLTERFTPGEHGAHAALAGFLADAAADYERGRDLPGIAGTSRLSPHLAFGEIAPWRVLEAAEAAAERDSASRPGIEAFIRQLYWREFGSYLLHHRPHTATCPLRPEFDAMPWSDDDAGLAAWLHGRTGFPIVDAGMRELAATGWMHNRVRMLAASLLTKDLLVPWQTGERVFWDLLADADPGNNVLGWQWVAGSGADAAPYFRIFNPAAQGERYDPGGAYVRAWVPELSRLPDRWIHRPHEAAADVLTDAGVVLGDTYPLPIVDHAEARDRALAAYDVVRAARR